MPIGLNTSNFKLSARSAISDRVRDAVRAPDAVQPPAPVTMPVPTTVPTEPAPNPFMGAEAIAATSFPGVVTRPPFAIDPGRPPLIDPGLILPPRPPAPPQHPSALKTATQLARGALAQLLSVGPDKVTQAINAIGSVSLDGPGIMTHLERKTRIRVVLDSFAQQWDANTRADFADAFRMPADQTDAMDAVVSLAILNDRDLEDEILGENTADTTSSDLTDNRRIVWQHPPAGTVLQPPYVILVAVEYRDIASAADVYKSIADQLVNYTRGPLTLKVPRDVAQRLG